MSAIPARRHLTAAETAKLVRKHLRADFPGIKFSVRSSTYAGGASIDVGWTDGPLCSTVDAVLSLYSGATFDGMQDLKSYHDSLLMTDDGPQPVHFGADFVFSNRRVSDARSLVYFRELERFIGERLDRERAHHQRVAVSVVGSHQPEMAGQLSRDDHQGEYVSTIVGMMGRLRPWKGERCPGSDSAYCDGCGRWQKGHESEPHLR